MIPIFVNTWVVSLHSCPFICCPKMFDSIIKSMCRSGSMMFHIWKMFFCFIMCYTILHQLFMLNITCMLVYHKWDVLRVAQWLDTCSQEATVEMDQINELDEFVGTSSIFEEYLKWIETRHIETILAWMDQGFVRLICLVYCVINSTL